MSNEVGELIIGTRTVGSAVVLSVAGEVDVVSAPKLAAAAADAASSASTLLVVDLSQVKFFGSAGLSVLVGARETAPDLGLKVIASAQVRRPIEVTGLDKVLEVYDTLEQALGGE